MDADGERGSPVSIRAPPTRAGRPDIRSALTCCQVVSIRAPPTRAGRRGPVVDGDRQPAFQSAPRPRGRGDFVSTSVVPSHASFNPRPAHAGGATYTTSTCVEVLLSFQSAPRPRGRGDKRGLTSHPHSRGFNPRPAHAGGATSAAAKLYRDMKVSIRAPPTRAGRPNVTTASPSAALFQSAPRPRGRGDVKARGETISKLVFQSAPRPRGRGDVTFTVL